MKFDLAKGKRIWNHLDAESYCFYDKRFLSPDTSLAVGTVDGIGSNPEALFLRYIVLKCFEIQLKICLVSRYASTFVRALAVLPPHAHGQWVRRYIHSHASCERIQATGEEARKLRKAR